MVSRDVIFSEIVVKNRNYCVRKANLASEPFDTVFLLYGIIIAAITIPLMDPSSFLVMFLGFFQRVVFFVEKVLFISERSREERISQIMNLKLSRVR